MATKKTWLNAGLTTLAEHGATGLRIDSLAASLGLSKGSFYHHFAGISGYRLDLLAHYEAELTTRYIDVVEAEAGLGPREKWSRLLEAVLAEEGDQPNVEVAMRAWAAQDDDARVTQQRVDATRIAYLQSLWLQITGDDLKAADMGRMLYLLLIGAHHVVPPLTASEMRRLYEVTLVRVDEGASQ